MPKEPSATTPPRAGAKGRRLRKRRDVVTATDMTTSQGLFRVYGNRGTRILSSAGRESPPRLTFFAVRVSFSQPRSGIPAEFPPSIGTRLAQEACGAGIRQRPAA